MEATLSFSVYAAVVLAIVRFRFKSPIALNNSHVFKSKNFSDRQILVQLCSDAHSTKLSLHQWPELDAMGPCFSTLAAHMLKGNSFEVALNKQTWLDERVKKLLLSRQQVVLKAMCEIAESYLDRGLKKQNKEKTATKDVPNVLLNGSKGKKYRPVKFIARGSAGAVFTAVRVAEEDNKLLSVIGGLTGGEKSKKKGSILGGKLKAAVNVQLQRQLALKQIEPTQKSSAENEYRIASILAAGDTDLHCVAYLDRADEDDDHLWLLLRRINPSPFGIDLAEYIQCQYFQTGTEIYHKYAQSIVQKLLLGLDYIGSCGICMRDVKPDNVLVEHDTNLEGEEKVLARWSDFGLSVDLGKGLDGSGLRGPMQHIIAGEAETVSDKDLLESIVGFWYDTQKLVPRPKWVGRRPPEKTYINPSKAHVSSYDTYMIGIIFASMAIGIDIPHIDKASTRSAFESKLQIKLPKDYLKTLELGAFLRTNREKVMPCFKHSFGEAFGESLLSETIEMLNVEPAKRPQPKECFDRLEAVSNYK